MNNGGVTVQKELVELKGENIKLKGEEISYKDLAKLEVGTLVVGMDSNSIYEITGYREAYNRKKKVEVSTNSLGACYYLGVDNSKEIEEF